MPTASLNSIGGPLFPVGIQGELAGPAESYDIEPRVNENATALDVGDVACRGAATVPGQIGNCKPMASGAVVLGITVRERSRVADSNGNVLFAQYSTVRILKDGWIWVVAAENVTEGDSCIGVVADPASVGGTTGGAANGTTRLAFPAGAVWEQTVTTGNVGLVHIKAA